MPENPDSQPVRPPLPQAVERRRFRFHFIWIVPLLAAGLAGWLVYQNVSHWGTTITLRFADGRGVQAGQTLVRYRGVRVGDVQSV